MSVVKGKPTFRGCIRRVQRRAKGTKTTDILRKLNGDDRTVGRFVSDSEHRPIRSDEGLLRNVSDLQKRTVFKGRL